MNILCLNTSFSETYVAVNNDKEVATKIMDSSLKQSENVLGAVDACLNEVNITLNNIDIIACVIGPGSFTGIRIGTSLVKGFCQALPNIKKVEINSLDLLAYERISSNSCQNAFWVVLNGLSGNLFACKYNKEGKRINKPMLCYGEELEQINGEVVGLECENLSMCNKLVNFTCDGLINFTKEQVALNAFSNDFNPVYLRKSQAEAQLDNKKSNS